MSRPIPTLDQFDEQRVSPQMENVLSIRAEIYFRQAHPEFEDYTADAMSQLRGWCSIQCVPITLRNLEVAYYDLQASGSLRKDIEKAIEQFRAQCPDWDMFQSKQNGAAMEKWLDERGLEPTVENLHAAFQYCVKARRILPTAAAQGIISTKDTVVVPEGVHAEERSRWLDKPHESDFARKKRDAELRRQAIADRVARRKVQ